MSTFYTHISSSKKGILFRGYENGVRVHKVIGNYKPSLFVPTNGQSDYRTVLNQPLKRLQFDNIEEAQNFQRANEDIDHDYLFGMTRWNFAYLADTFSSQIDYQPNLIRKATLDIEVDTSRGYAKIYNPFAPIITITVKYRGTFYVFGLKPYRPKAADVKYKQFPDEQTMLRTFIEFWQKLDLDVLFGWNTDQYDIPYIVNRIRRIFGPKAADLLSPWRYIRDMRINFKGQQIETYEISGISSLDYIDLYRRYMPKSESDALGFVAEQELGETKVEYDGTLHELYEKDFDKFVEYNVQDVALVEKLDAKLKLADMVFATAYDSKCNFTDVQQQVRMWDTITFNELRERKYVVPFIKQADKEKQFTGAYVLPCNAGKHKWVVSFDFASLYPSLMIEHNISVDTVVDHYNTVFPGQTLQFDKEEFVSRTMDLSLIHEKDVTLSGAGFVFRKDKQGFLPNVLAKKFAERMQHKKAYKEAEKKFLAATTPEDKKFYENEMAKFHNFQLAKKLQLNAAYGAFGSEYFRWFSLPLATSVTLSGRRVLILVKEHITKRLQEKYKMVEDPIIYGDTDSLYISAKAFVATLPEGLSSPEIVERIDAEFCKKEISTYITEALAIYRKLFNTYTPQLEMIRDVIAEDTIFVSKKRYLMEIWDKEGQRYKAPKRKATGLEMIKSTTPKFCKQWLNTAAGVILKGTQNELDILTDQYREEFRKLPVELISYPTNVNNIEKYEKQLSAQKVITFDERDEDSYDTEERELKKGAPIGVAAAFAFNRFLKENKLNDRHNEISSGVRMRYVYLKRENPFRSHVMGMLEKAPAELQLEQWIDYEKQFEKLFLKPLNILIKAARWRMVGGAPNVMSIFD